MGIFNKIAGGLGKLGKHASKGGKRIGKTLDQGSRRYLAPAVRGFLSFTNPVGYAAFEANNTRMNLARSKGQLKAYRRQIEGRIREQQSRIRGLTASVTPLDGAPGIFSTGPPTGPGLPIFLPLGVGPGKINVMEIKPLTGPLTIDVTRFIKEGHNKKPVPGEIIAEALDKSDRESNLAGIRGILVVSVIAFFIVSLFRRR